MTDTPITPIDKDKFNLKYLVLGDPTNPSKDWWKAMGAGIKLLIIIAIPALLVYIGFNWGWQEYAKRHPQNVYNGPTTVIQNVPEKKPVARLELKLWWIDLDLHGPIPK